MSILQSIYRRFSALPSEDEDEDEAGVVKELANLWPSAPQEESTLIAPRRRIVGLPAVEESQYENDREDSIMSKKSSTEPLTLPAIKRDSDTLLQNFMQRCVEIAVGQQVRKQALKYSKEKLETAVAFHDSLRRDYSELCCAVARVVALRPWYRSEKRLAETRIELSTKRGPVREDEFWAPRKDFFDEEGLDEKCGPFGLRAEITAWDERSWSPRILEIVPWENDKENVEPGGFSEKLDCLGEFSLDDGTISSLGKAQSTATLRRLLQDDLEAMDNNDEESDVSPTSTPDTRTLPSSPTIPGEEDTEHGQERQDPVTGLWHKVRYAQGHVDPRRTSLSPEERASMKQDIRSQNDSKNHLWSNIHHAQTNHNLSSKPDIARIEFCTKMLQTISNIEIEWEVQKEITADERNRAQLLVLKLQWDLNGSQKLKKDIDANLAHKRQKQMDLWEDIVCAAALRGTPVVEKTNIFGSVQYGSDADEQDIELMLLSPRNAEGRGPEQSIEPFKPRDPGRETLFGSMESDFFGPMGSEWHEDGSAQDDGEQRTIRLDSAGPDFDSAGQGRP